MISFLGDEMQILFVYLFKFYSYPVSSINVNQIESYKEYADWKEVIFLLSFTYFSAKGKPLQNASSFVLVLTKTLLLLLFSYNNSVKNVSYFPRFEDYMYQ